MTLGADLARLLLGCGLAAGLFPVLAQSTPGEDPVQLTGRVEYLSLPGPALAKSGNLDGRMDMPAWLKARVARYEARAFSGLADDNLLSDNDVVSTASAQGLRKTCVQEVGSNSSTGSGIGPQNQYGPGRQQIVVLRGDLVNVCK